MTTWGELFERAGEHQTSVETIRDRLEAHRANRADSDRPTGTGGATDTGQSDGNRREESDPER
jgi:hypothetical protein